MNIDLLWDKVSFFASLWAHALGAFRADSLSYLHRDRRAMLHYSFYLLVSLIFFGRPCPPHLLFINITGKKLEGGETHPSLFDLFRLSMLLAYI